MAKWSTAWLAPPPGSVLPPGHSFRVVVFACSVNHLLHLAGWDDCTVRLALWLSTLCHPDGMMSKLV